MTIIREDCDFLPPSRLENSNLAPARHGTIFPVPFTRVVASFSTEAVSRFPLAYSVERNSAPALRANLIYSPFTPSSHFPRSPTESPLQSRSGEKEKDGLVTNGFHSGTGTAVA